MVAIKYLVGLVVAFHLFVVSEAYTQHFYAVRYGKRGDNEVVGDSAAEGKRMNRRDDENALIDRKIRFFISGGRYGKREYSAGELSDGSSEIVTKSGYVDYQYPSDRFSSVPNRRNQFMMGSRFGKRREGSTVKCAEKRPVNDTWCLLTRNEDFCRCFVYKKDSKKGLQHHVSEFNFATVDDEVDA